MKYRIFCLDSGKYIDNFEYRKVIGKDCLGRSICENDKVKVVSLNHGQYQYSIIDITEHIYIEFCQSNNVKLYLI